MSNSSSDNGNDGCDVDMLCEKGTQTSRGAPGSSSGAAVVRQRVVLKAAKLVHIDLSSMRSAESNTPREQDTTDFVMRDMNPLETVSRFSFS